MTSYQPRDMAVQGSNLVSGHAAPAAKGQIDSVSAHRRSNRMIVLSILIPYVSA